MSREVILQVKEMVERNLNMHEIAQRMHVDISVVQSALKLINDMLT
jgi:transposase-like protein